MEEKLLRKISGITAIIALIANVITIGVFLKDLLLPTRPLVTKSVATSLILIAAFFGFAVLLMRAAREEWPNQMTTMGKTFSWIYLILAALLLSFVSYRFIIDLDYRAGEYFGMVGLISMIIALAAIILAVLKEMTKAFAAPFMVVALWQILLFTYRLIFGMGIVFNWFFVGNLFLFVYSGVIVLIFFWADVM